MIVSASARAAVDRGGVDRVTVSRRGASAPKRHRRQRAGEVGRRCRVRRCAACDDPAAGAAVGRDAARPRVDPRAVDRDAFGRPPRARSRSRASERVEHHRSSPRPRAPRPGVPGEIGGDHRSEVRRCRPRPGPAPGRRSPPRRPTRAARRRRRARGARTSPSAAPAVGQAVAPARVVEVVDRLRAEVGDERRRRCAAARAVRRSTGCPSPTPSPSACCSPSPRRVPAASPSRPCPPRSPAARRRARPHAAPCNWPSPRAPTR